MINCQFFSHAKLGEVGGGVPLLFVSISHPPAPSLILRSLCMGARESQASELAVFSLIAFCAIPVAGNKSKSWFCVFGGKSETKLSFSIIPRRETGWTVKPFKVEWADAFVPGGKNERFSYCVLMTTSRTTTGSVTSRFCNNRELKQARF